MPQLRESRGRGWFNDSERHSRARKYGKAGGVYRSGSGRASPPILQQKESEFEKVTDKSFKQWLEEKGGMKGVIEYYDVDIDDYVHYYQERYPNMSEKEIKEMVIQELRKEYEDNYDNWIWKYKMSGFPITLYREIILSDGARYGDIGEYWTDDKDKAESHWGGSWSTDKQDKRRSITLKTEAQRDDINWEETIDVNMSPSLGEEEQEIRLKKGIPILITEVLDDDDNVLQRNIKAKT